MPLNHEAITALLSHHQEISGMIHNLYEQQLFPLDLRILLAEWISDNGSLWFIISEEMSENMSLKILTDMADFLKQALMNKDNENYRDKAVISRFLNDIQMLTNDGSRGKGILLKLKACLFYETKEYNDVFQVEDIDNTVMNLMRFSQMLAAALEQIFMGLEKLYRTSPNDLTSQQTFWLEQHGNIESAYHVIDRHDLALQTARQVLVNYRAKFVRQISKECFSEEKIFHLSQLQVAFDIAAEIAMQDLVRIQVVESFLQQVGFLDIASRLRPSAEATFNFLAHGLVGYSLVLEKQMPQIARKGSKFQSTPYLRMLCPSVLFDKSSLKINEYLTNSLVSQVMEPRSSPKIDSFIEQQLAHVSSCQSSTTHHQTGTSKGKGKGVATANNIQKPLPDVDIDVYFLSEPQALKFVQSLELPPKDNSGFYIQTSQLTWDLSGNHCGVFFKQLLLNKFSRGDRDSNKLVTEEKYCLAFTSLIPIRGLVQLNKAQHSTEVLASVLSLPMVVTVHNSQEASAAIATFWDNYFCDINRLPFQVPREASLKDVKQLLNGRWKAVCGEGLSELSLNYLANRLLQTRKTEWGPSGSASTVSTLSHNYISDDTIVTWENLAKDYLPGDESDRFTFWDWFYSCLKLMTKDCLLPYWPQYLVGFASHDEVEEMMKGQPPGTFLLRFATTRMGAIVIPYVRRRKSGGTIVERGYGPCTFKEKENKACKIIEDLEKLKYFFPSMKHKEQVIQEIGEARQNNSTTGPYKSLDRKIVDSTENDDDDNDAKEQLDYHDKMHCDALSETSTSPLSHHHTQGESSNFINSATGDYTFQYPPGNQQPQGLVFGSMPNSGQPNPFYSQPHQGANNLDYSRTIQSSFHQHPE